MQSPSSSPRLRAIVSLVGAVLTMVGFFLPMLTQSNPQVPGSAGPYYEWEAVNIDTMNGCLTVLFSLLAALPFLGALLVLITSGAAVVGAPLPWPVSLKRVAAGWGLGLQLLFDVFVFGILVIGYARTDIAWGFVVVLVGFIVTAIGVFVVEAPQSSVQSSSSPLRFGAMISLVGVALIMIGFFLPIFTLRSSPEVLVYEWQVNMDPLNLSQTVLFGLLAAFPLLCTLLVLTASVAALVGIPLPELVSRKRAVAGWGLGLQLLFDALVLLIVGYGGLQIAWGFGVVLLGFIVTVIGTNVGVIRRNIERTAQS